MGSLMNIENTHPRKELDGSDPRAYVSRMVPVATEELLAGLNETERKHAPEFLYTAGNVEFLQCAPRVSIIGSRDASRNGYEKAGLIAQLIVRREGVVVSGLATGIDTAAHIGAMENGGATIAVIGTPLDRFYPKENKELQERLMREQLVVSQFASGQPVTPKNFVIRNRTMALISQASIIVEAGQKSGTEHQGWETIRLGRILLLPKALVEAGYEWPEQMCEYGALLFGSKSELEHLLDEHLPTVHAEAFCEAPF